MAATDRLSTAIAVAFACIRTPSGVSGVSRAALGLESVATRVAALERGVIRGDARRARASSERARASSAGDGDGAGLGAAAAADRFRAIIAVAFACLFLVRVTKGASCCPGITLMMVATSQPFSLNPPWS